MRTLVLAATVVAGLCGLVWAQTEAPSGPLALVVRYTNGRTAYLPLTENARTSLPTIFPRIPGPSGLEAKSTDELCLTYRRDGRGGIVDVTVRHHDGVMEIVKVATVAVTADAPVSVDALKTFGIAPIALQVTTVTVPNVLRTTTTESRAEMLRASASLDATEEGWTFHVNVENTSTTAIRSVSFETFRGGVPGAMGGQRGSAGEALIPPGGRVQIPIPVSLAAGPNGTAVLNAPDRVAIVAATGVNGALYGDPVRALGEWIYDVASRIQIIRIAALFRQAASDTRPVESALDALDVMLRSLSIEPDTSSVDRVTQQMPAPGVLSAAAVTQALRGGLRSTRDNAVKDLGDFRQSPTAPNANAVRTWLDSQAARYDAWSERLPK